MSGYPETDEILKELGQFETDEGQSVADEGVAEIGRSVEQQDAKEGKATEDPYLDFNEYRSHQLTYKANGQEYREPLEKIIQHASMGRDYAQKMQEFKAKQAEYEKIKQERETLQKWKSYDDYARENPQWAEYVEKMWNERSRYSNPDLDPDDPQTQVLSKLQQTLEERLSQYDQRFKSVEQFIQGRNVQAEDEALDQEINEVRSKFDYIDFNQVDQSGRSVEMNVLDHMTKTGIKNFRTAFLDLYQDEVLSKAESRALEKSALARQKQAKQGIVGVSETPTSLSKASKARPRNDMDAYAAALDWMERHQA